MYPIPDCKGRKLNPQLFNKLLGRFRVLKISFKFGRRNGFPYTTVVTEPASEAPTMIEDRFGIQGNGFIRTPFKAYSAFIAEFFVYLLYAEILFCLRAFEKRKEHVCKSTFKFDRFHRLSEGTVF